MPKKISWLEKFAEDQAGNFTKTASLNKKASQVIVDHDDCPDASVGSEVTYRNEKYKVVQTDFHDELGDGILLEKLADGEEVPTEGEDTGMENTAGLEDIKNEEATDEFKEEELPAVSPEVPAAGGADYESEPAPTGNPGTAPIAPGAQTITMAPAGGPKVAPSAPIVAPGQKKVTDAPEHPMYDPGSTAYHIEVRDTTEVQNFQQAATETEQAIAAEDAVDRTNVPGHYTWNQNRILDRMVTDMTGMTPEVAPAVQEDPLQESELPELEPEVKETTEEVVETPEESTEETTEEVTETPEETEVEETTEEDEDKKNKFAANRILKRIINS